MQNIGFGLEKIGLVALRRPIWFAVLVAALTAVTIFGVSRLKFDDDVVNAFRSDSQSYRDFAKLLEDRNGASNDVVLFAEADRPIDAEMLKSLRDMHFDLEFAEGVGAVVSAFSLREPAQDDEPGPPLIPDEFDDAALPGIYSNIDASPLAFSRAISPDRRAMMFLVSEAVANKTSTALRDFIGVLDGIAAQYSLNGVKVSVLGMQKTRFEIADSILQDQIIFNSGGSLISILIAFAIFRNVRMTALVLSSGTAALVWTLGAAGLAGQPITVVTNIIPVLIIVISFTNSMHLVHALREHQRVDGEDRLAVIAGCVQRIGPACALTSLTTAAAFVSLSITGYGALTDLSWFGAAASMISFFAIISVFPLMALLLVRDEDIGTYRHKPGKPGELLQRLAAFIPSARIPIILIAIILLVAGAVGHLTTTPRFSTYDNIPHGNPLLDASLRAEDRFGGLFNLWIRISGNPREMMTGSEGWKKIIAVHKAAETVLGSHTVFSPLSIARAAGRPDQPLDAKTLDSLPPEVIDRIGRPGSAYVTLGTLVGDPARSDASIRHYDALEKAVLDAGASIVTGTPALARHDAKRMIMKLNASILAAAFATVLLVALAFRTFSLIPAIALANLTPVLLTGAILHIFTAGETKIATGLAMTVAFGVAVDDTIHFINRTLLERNAGVDAVGSIRNATVGVGFVLCATTLVLGAGISLTFLSNFITVRLFGELMIMILFFALVADLLVLPAMMLTYRRWGAKTK